MKPGKKVHTHFIQKKVAKFLMGVVFSRQGVFDPKKDKRFEWYIRYICFSCSFCRALEFLKCTNKYCGEWKCFSFHVNSNSLSKLLSPYFGEKQQLHKKKKKGEA